MEKPSPHAQSRQGGQDGERVQKALVENAEDDVYGEQRREDQQRCGCEGLLESARIADEGAADRTGHADRGFGVGDGLDSLTQRSAWGKIERNIDRRKHAQVVDGHRRRLWPLELRHREQRYHLPGEGRAEPEVVQRLGIAAKARIDFDDHVILIGLGLILQDLALSERVVQHLIDVVRADAEAGRGFAVDGQARDARAQLQVARYVAQLRLAGERIGQPLRPGV